jgi:hypothetical protein
MAGVGMVTFVGTALVVFYRAGWPHHQFPVPVWSFPLVALAWVLIIVGSVMASGEDDDGKQP